MSAVLLDDPPEFLMLRDPFPSSAVRSGNGLWVRFLAGLLLLLTGIPRDAFAQEDTVSDAQRGGFVSELRGKLDSDLRLKMSIVPQFQTLRGQAPLNCLLRLQWDGPGLLEGRLLCDVYAGGQYVVSWKSPDLVVTDQMSTYPLMLPPGPLNNDKASYAVRAVFQTEDRQILLDPRDLPVPTRWSRQFVLGVIAPASVAKIAGFTSEQGPPQLIDLFQLAKFHPDRAYGSEFSVSIAPVLPADVPIEPLRFTAFDAVLITEEALAELRPASLEAIATWVAAGGRACVVATERVPAALRSAWQRLVTQRQSEPLVTLVEDGQPTAVGLQKVVRVRRGCGRVLCLLEAANIDRPAWDEDILWFFGVRRDQSELALSSGSWEVAPLSYMTNDYERLRPFGPGRFPVEHLKGPLVATSVRGVWPGSVILLLSVCLLLIGPVDYFVLGRMGLRKWTWVFLPMVALSTTWAMVRMSRALLGSQSLQRSLVVADLDADHEIVRVSRFELQFSAVEEVRKLDIHGVLRIDFEPAIVGKDMLAQGNEQLGSSLAVERNPGGAPVRYANYIPSDYEFHEPVRQWSPRLFRETKFGEDPRVSSAPLAPIDWAFIERTDWRTDEGRQAIGEAIRAAIPEALVLIRSQLKTHILAPAADQQEQSRERTQFEQLPQLVADLTSIRQVNDRNKPFGLSSVLSERSPTCGPDFEDLAWVDPSNPDEAVLLIGIPGDDVTVFRCRLTVPEAPSKKE